MFHFSQPASGFNSIPKSDDFFLFYSFSGLISHKILLSFWMWPHCINWAVWAFDLFIELPLQVQKQYRCDKLGTQHQQHWWEKSLGSSWSSMSQLDSICVDGISVPAMEMQKMLNGLHLLIKFTEKCLTFTHIQDGPLLCTTEGYFQSILAFENTSNLLSRYNCLGN